MRQKHPISKINTTTVFAKHSELPASQAFHATSITTTTTTLELPQTT